MSVSADIVTALIAVGGTVVGATAGLVGGVIGARVQSKASLAAAEIQAQSAANINRQVVENARAQAELQIQSAASINEQVLASARSQVLLQESLRWVDRAYSDLGTMLQESRELGTSIHNYDVYGDAVVKLQRIDTLADLLIANPLINSDSTLVESLRRYVAAFSSQLYDEWRQTHEGAERTYDGTPPGTLGNLLAVAIGKRLVEVTSSVGL